VPFVVKKTGAWNERKNIIVMVDEAHRTQEGDLGRKMREALPNAFLFGLTGTPINRADKNTFWAFGADEDVKGYMSRCSFQDSIRDKATLPLHFEAPAVKLKIDKAAIDEAYKQITGDLSEQDRNDLAKRAAKMAVLVKNPKRVRAVVEHIVQHFQTKVEPNGFKAQVVCFDRECCVLYKKVMDELIGPEASAVVMSSAQHDKPEWKEHIRDKDAEEKLLDRFRDPADPLKFVIVTSKLLTGFDAPILQVMYLDKPMKDHNLLLAICRVNRTYGQTKTRGLIVDYIGIFDNVAQALDFDEKAVRDDLEALVLDADVLDGILKDVEPGKQARKIAIQLIARLRKHAGNPKFTELGERLEKIREKHEQSLLNSLEFLKAILEVAKDTVEAENRVDPEKEKDKALSALTELFNEVKSKHTDRVLTIRLATNASGDRFRRFAYHFPSGRSRRLGSGRRRYSPCAVPRTTPPAAVRSGRGAVGATSLRSPRRDASSHGLLGLSHLVHGLAQ